MSEWDSYAADWDADQAARAYAAAAFGSLQALLSTADVSLAGAVVLDFGCGTGLLTELLVEQGATVHAVDTSPAMLQVLQTKISGRAWTSVETSTELPTTAAGYQVVVCSSVCSFLDDYPGTVRALVNLLKPEGIFVQWDWERDEKEDDAHGLSRAEIVSALTGAGLIDVTVDVGFEIPFEDQVMRPLMGLGYRPAR